MKANFVTDLNGRSGSVGIWHKLFGEQFFLIEKLYIIFNENKIGVRIKSQDIYIDKGDITKFIYDGNGFMVMSDMVKIVVMVNNI